MEEKFVGLTLQGSIKQDESGKIREQILHYIV